MGNCFMRGSEVIWQSDFDAEDVGWDRKGLIHYYSCPDCGAEHEVFEPMEDEDGEEISAEQDTDKM